MRKIKFTATMFLAALCGVTVLSAQDVNMQSLTLRHAGVKEIHATLPTCITVANNGSDAI